MIVAQQFDAMANPEHLAKLKEGVEAWNKWREDSSDSPPELAGAALANAELAAANLNAANLTGADLTEANLRGANLSRANLETTNLFGANLVLAQIINANLSGTVLADSNLSGAILMGSNLSLATLAGAQAERADFRMADLHYADLTDASLAGANLRDVNLSQAIFFNSHLEDVVVANTVFGNNDLSTTKGLETAHHFGPSTIGIDTILRSKGTIPESFLRGAGVPEAFITFARSLATSPIEFYSCFISYSSKDDGFATELHTRLQEQHVRCWKDSEDLKIGDKFQDEIERAIRLHDKLLVVLSENSVNSSWVEREVQAAFEKEQRQGSAVLFPVRLDDAVMDNPRAWAADIRRTRHIGDFRKWKDHDSFQKSLDRLLRDLKSRGPKPK